VGTVNVQSPVGDLARTVELPDDVFDVPVNVPLIHQVVVAQLAAARQGSHDTRTRGEVSGGGKKPYRQKGTGRARQGSIRAPQFTGGGTVHGPTPRSYEQRTPKKMKAAALRGALSDRARHARVHIVTGLVEEAISTKTAVANLRRITGRRHVLVVAERADELTWKSLRNVPEVHLIAPDQVNTYDVLVSDDVVFTEGGLARFLAGPAGTAATAGAGGEALGTVRPAGAGVSDEEMVAQVTGQTDPNLRAEPVDEAEAPSGGDSGGSAEGNEQ
jgi:large subunit ribosomal protein L4